MKNNKQAIVTGGTSGVGLSIVKALIKANYFVTFIGSNNIKGKTVETNLGNLAHFVQLDLSDITAIKQFIASYLKVNTKLDLLVNVAGIMSPKQQLTPGGLDKTFTIGYLSAFILSTELIPLLEKGNNPRIINVGGQASHVLKTNLDFENLNFTKKYSGFKTAIATVHAKTVLTQILAEKLNDKNIDVNSFHPGTVKSDLTRNMPLIIKFLAKLASPLMAKESTNGIFVCLDESINGVSGKLFVKQNPINLVFNLDYRIQLIKVTKMMIKKST